MQVSADLHDQSGTLHRLPLMCQELSGGCNQWFSTQTARHQPGQMYQMRYVHGTLQIQSYSSLLKSIAMEDKQITLQIDGHFITVPEGSTILEAATKIGINIPTLCHIDLKGTCIKIIPLPAASVWSKS